MTDAPDAELAPCPVCGGEAWIDYFDDDIDVGMFVEGWAVDCDGSCAGDITVYETRAEAIAAWNAAAQERQAHE